ncbi:MAG: hypothetical protein ACRC45_03280 [Cetobacterium sp.]
MLLNDFKNFFVEVESMGYKNINNGFEDIKKGISNVDVTTMQDSVIDTFNAGRDLGGGAG